MIAFRLDANPTVATGHLFRCVSIARECKALGEECVFLLAEDLYTEVLEANGLRYHILNIPFDDWDSGADAVRECVLRYGAECLVVDSYYVTPSFFQKLSKAIPVFYLDDLCNARYEVSAVLHYEEWEDEGILADLYRGTDTKVYAGMRYTPLRREFSESSASPDRKYDLLITTGGTDPHHITRELIGRMRDEGLLGRISVCAVLGKMNADREAIERICEGYPGVSILQNISNMHMIMRQSTLAVTAGGTTVFELMASGTLFVAFGFSDDQIYFGKRLEQHGVCSFAGDARKDVDAVLRKVLAEVQRMLALSTKRRNVIVERNQEMMDGKGSFRVAQAIMATKTPNEVERK